MDIDNIDIWAKKFEIRFVTSFGTRLIISKEEMEDIVKIVKSLLDGSGVLIKRSY